MSIPGAPLKSTLMIKATPRLDLAELLKNGAELKLLYMKKDSSKCTCACCLANSTVTIKHQRASHHPQAGVQEEYLHATPEYCNNGDIHRVRPIWWFSTEVYKENNMIQSCLRILQQWGHPQSDADLVVLYRVVKGI